MIKRLYNTYKTNTNYHLTAIMNIKKLPEKNQGEKSLFIPLQLLRVRFFRLLSFPPLRRRWRWREGFALRSGFC